MEKVLCLRNLNPQLLVQYKSFNTGHFLKPEIVRNSTSSSNLDIKQGSMCSKSPITFVRQVVALCVYPDLFKEDSIPVDAKRRAEKFLSCLPARAVGSYSLNPGIHIARANVANFISKRDGHSCNVSDIVTLTGSNEGISCFMELFATGGAGNPKAAIMLSVPTDPVYTELATKYDMVVIPYYRHEETGWSVEYRELKRAINEAKDTSLPNIILIANPNSPTGKILSREDIEGIIKFSYEENVLILVDESLQHNVYSEDTPFLSFKKVVMEMDGDFTNLPLVSLNSISNGYIRENGFRGGYAEVLNFNTDIWKCIYELLSAQHVPVTAQIVLDVMTNPPVPDEQSYEQYSKERTEILSSLANKANIASSVLLSMKGIHCTTITAGLTAFPKLILPEKAVLAAKKFGLDPDIFYCCELEKESGVISVPGSTYGIRGDNPYLSVSFDVEDVEGEFARFKEFHEKFLTRYS